MLTFERLFQGSQKAHGEQTGINFNKISREGKANKKSVTLPGPVDFNKHLNGVRKYGCIPFVSNDRCLFGSIDIDIYQGYDYKNLIKRLKELQLPGCVVRSSNNGYHIHFHFQKEVPSYELKDKLNAVVQALQIPAQKTEIFPKQKRLVNGMDGNYIYLPYYPRTINTEKKIEEDRLSSHGFDDEGNPLLTINSYEEYANTKLCKSLDDIPVATVQQKNAEEEQTNAKEDLKEAPPCIQHFYKAELKDGDGRNDAMFAFAMFEKKRSGGVEIQSLRDYNKRFKDPLPDGELHKIKSQVNLPTYNEYNCNARTLELVCDKETCLLMKFGRGKKFGENSYFENFIFVKDWNAVIKLKPTAKVYRTEEVRNTMKVEIGMLSEGRKLIHPFDKYLDKIARKTAVDVMEWQPGRPMLYDKKGHGGTIKVYNNYRGTTLEPIEGSIAPWEDFINKRFKVEECNKWFQDFLAHAIQKPWERTHSNVLLISNEEGTGKSLIDETMQVWLGIHNTASIDLADMQSGWADTVMNKVWISIEEIHDSGTHRKRIANIIKRLTTIKNMFGNLKYGKFQQADIYTRLMFMTNEQTAITVKKTNRRPFIYRLDNDEPKYVEENQAEGDQLVEWLKEDQGYEKVLSVYQNRDISEFNAKGRPPETKAKAIMVSKTHEWKYATLLSAWKTKSWPFTAQSLVYCPTHVAKLLKVDEDEITDLFKDGLGCEKLARVDNCEFEVWSRDTANEQKTQVDQARQNLNLWTDDEDLKASDLRPKDILEHYLHPCMNGQKKVFAQDRRINFNLLNRLNQVD